MSFYKRIWRISWTERVSKKEVKENGNRKNISTQNQEKTANIPWTYKEGRLRKHNPPEGILKQRVIRESIEILIIRAWANGCRNAKLLKAKRNNKFRKAMVT